MKTDAVTSADIARAVWAVPPLAVGPDHAPAHDANAALTAHVEAGGVSTILWGGNANIPAMTAAEFAAMVEAIPDWVAPGTWAIPSAGPGYGTLRDQARTLRGTAFPAVMLLPYTGARMPAGMARMVRDFADRSGKPVILYLRAADYIAPDDIGALFEDGVAVALKYAVETGDFARDPYLDAVLDRVDRARVVSGIGEIAGIAHVPPFGLAGFTAGAVCIAPRRATAILAAVQGGDIDRARTLADPIRPLEALRVAHGPIPVIHEAVTASGVADMGPLWPHFAPLDDALRARIAEAAAPLLAGEADLARAA